MFYLVIIWTFIAIILHCTGADTFKDWPIISWPWKWSCLCVFEWFIIMFFLLLMGIIGTGVAIVSLGY